MPAKLNLSKKRGKAKVKITEKRKQAMNKIVDTYSQDQDVIVNVIQELIPLGLQAVAEHLQEEVKHLVGQRHQRGTDNDRWGSQPGSVYLRDQKIPIMVPRVRNTRRNEEVPLELYQKLQQPYQDDRQTVLKLLNGISTHQYRQSAELVPEVFGISASNLSKRFKTKATSALRKLQTRPLSQHDIVCIFIDAKRYADDGLIVILGVAIDGQKILLGIEQMHSENSRVASQFLDRLIERGLNYEQGILFIVDGSKGFIKAIENRFGTYQFIQRCQWHKRENILAYLDKKHRALCRRKLKVAYQQTNYKQAKQRMEELYYELLPLNESAANSLLEGLEETLTLHKFGVSVELGKSLNTTNCIESILSQLGQYTDKVDRWHNSQQILRWAAAGLMEIEPRLRKIKGCRYLNVLRFKMLEDIKRRQGNKSVKNFVTTSA